MNDWTRADRWRTELAGAAGAVPIDLVAAFGIALLEELGRRGTPHGALSPEMISVRRDGSALRVRIDAWPTDPTQETLLATGSRSMAAHPGVHYRANEQFTMNAFDARADCFAVGVMLYELAVGQLPFGQGLTGSFQVFLKLKRGGFTPLRELRPDIPEALAATIVRALALRPEERFDGVAAMASALRTVVRPPAPIAASSSMTIGSPVPARLAPDRSGVPLDPLRPLETKQLPVATQAAIAAHRASEAQTPPKADPPRAGHAPLSPPIAAPTSLPPPREVPLPVRAIVEAVTHREPSAPTPTPSQPIPRAEPPVRAAPLATPPARPIVMVPPRVAPSATPPSRPMVVVPRPVIDRPAPAEADRPPRVAPRLGPQTDPFAAQPRSERTQVTAPPAMETPRRITEAHRGIGPDPMATDPPKPAMPRTVPPPPPRPTKPLAEAEPPRVRIAPDVAPQVTPQPPPMADPPLAGTAPHIPMQAPSVQVRPPAASASPTATATTVAPAPLQAELRARSVELVEPELAALQRMMAPPAPRAPAPIPVPPRSEAAVTTADDDQPAPPTDDTARRAAGEITPPKGNPSEPTPPPLDRTHIVIISSILLLLGIGAGLIIRLPARASKQAAAAQCIPGPAVVCPPPEPVAMPEPIPPKPIACVPPKPSPKLTCFYDGLSDGTARYLRGDRRGALTAFQAAERCMPHNPRLLKWIGRCHEELKDRDEARTSYEEYLRRRPKAGDADFYHERVQALSRAPDGGMK